MTAPKPTPPSLTTRDRLAEILHRRRHETEGMWEWRKWPCPYLADFPCPLAGLAKQDTDILLASGAVVAPVDGFDALHAAVQALADEWVGWRTDGNYRLARKRLLDVLAGHPAIGTACPVCGAVAGEPCAVVGSRGESYDPIEGSARPYPHYDRPATARFTTSPKEEIYMHPLFPESFPDGTDAATLALGVRLGVRYLREYVDRDVLGTYHLSALESYAERLENASKTGAGASNDQAVRWEVKQAVEEWFSNVSLDDLFAVKGWATAREED